MNIGKLVPARAIALACMLALTGSQAAFSQPAAAPAPPAQLTSPPSITLGEARAIIDGALAFAHDRNMLMSVVVLDTTGEEVASARMDGGAVSNLHFAHGKAYASLMFRQTTEVLSEVQKTRPDRYFGILNMYPGQVYLVGGGEPLSVNGRLVGSVGVAGLPQGVDEMAGRAGMAAWEKYRANTR